MGCRSLACWVTCGERRPSAVVGGEGQMIGAGEGTSTMVGWPNPSGEASLAASSAHPGDVVGIYCQRLVGSSWLRVWS